MKAWKILIHAFTGEPTTQIVCGECSEGFEHHEMQKVQDPREIYSEKCSICEKVAGDYFTKKAA